ncbi:DUF2953 domain-containing protein [Alkalihalobacillus oceani]|uniref:DUF2953 domain-containing protein n=1 Tax=Halalkalibacter oceani TaxID=1653776 RepID=A0A9X2DQE8_9BACI|nr:DUF2953 domain-containing protein [Halalkalibacter oceani]MCM3715019.1 DUF2953 domain-containing protein [Halalkalibacter oceani]
MRWFLIILLILVLLLVLIMITKLTISIIYRHLKDDDLLEVAVRVWGMRVYTFSAPVIQLDDTSLSLIVREEQEMGPKKSDKTQAFTINTLLNDFRLLNDLVHHVVGLHQIMKRFLRHVSLKQLHWYTAFGVGEAAMTAQLSGVIWGLKGSMIGLLSHYVKVKQLPKLRVDPRFQEVITQVSFSCMISFRIGHAIVAGLMLLKHWKQRPTRSEKDAVQETM